MISAFGVDHGNYTISKLSGYSGEDGSSYERVGYANNPNYGKMVQKPKKGFLGIGKKPARYDTRQHEAVWEKRTKTGQKTIHLDSGLARGGDPTYSGKYKRFKGDGTIDAVAKSWQTKEGKNPNGGLNEKGRKSYERENPGSNLKAPVKAGDNPRRASFLARMGNMPGPERKPNGEPTRLLLSLKAWGASSKADAKKKAAAISNKNNVTKSYKNSIYFRDPQQNSKIQNIQREMLKNTAESAIVGGAVGYGRDQILRRIGPQFGMVSPPATPKEPKTYKTTQRRTVERAVRETLDRRKGMPVPKNRPYRISRRVMTAATKSNIKRGAVFAGVAGLGGLYSGYKEGRELPNRKNPRVPVAKFAAPIRHGVPAMRVRINGIIGDIHTHTSNGVTRHTFYSLMTKKPENIDPTKVKVQILRQPKSYRAD